MGSYEVKDTTGTCALSVSAPDGTPQQIEFAIDHPKSCVAVTVDPMSAVRHALHALQAAGYHPKDHPAFQASKDCFESAAYALEEGLRLARRNDQYLAEIQAEAMAALNAMYPNSGIETWEDWAGRQSKGIAVAEALRSLRKGQEAQSNG